MIFSGRGRQDAGYIGIPSVSTNAPESVLAEDRKYEVSHDVHETGRLRAMSGLPLQLLRAGFDAAVAAADPGRVLAAYLPVHGRTRVLGAGKAAAAMARAVEAAWPPEARLDGRVITRYGHGVPTRRIEVIEAGHPLPDAVGQQAASGLLVAAGELHPDDLLLGLISGGGSSLLSVPVPAVGLSALQAVTSALLTSGAPIQEINVVRKHLSQILGGRFAQATRAHICALVISDVAGDDLSAVASGPFAPDPSTYADAEAVLRRWRVEPPPAVARYLALGRCGAVPETPKPADTLFERVALQRIACARDSLAAAAAVFQAAGVRPVVLGYTVTGEAREVALVMAALVRECCRSRGQAGAPFAPPLVLLSGGECTVTVRGAGRGGRCTEFLLALMQAIGDLPDVYSLAADTDGLDGSEDNAGAWFGPATLGHATALGLDIPVVLDANDAYSVFAALGNLIVTGPTRTNVNDFRALMVV